MQSRLVRARCGLSLARGIEPTQIDTSGAVLYHAAFIRPNRYPEVWLKFSVNPTRFDPHKNFKFRIKWDGRYVAGVSKISGLRRTTEVIQHREGGDPSTSRKSPGHTEFAPITLERGVTHDPEFENWANKVWSLGAGRGAEVSLKDFRKDVVLELYNEAGQLVLAYKSIAVGLRNTKSCPTWTPTRMRSLSSKSSWKTKAENEIDQ